VFSSIKLGEIDGNWLQLVVSVLIGLSVSLGLIPVILKLSRRYGLASPARESHHTHQVSVSRLGGVALAAAMIVVAVTFYFLDPTFLQVRDRKLLLLGSLAMFALGLWDDLSAMGARRKLIGQIVIASAVYFGGISINHFRIPFTEHLVDFGYWGWPVTVLWLVAMTNLINLIDGVDGLAGGICLMLMVLLVYVSWQTGFIAITSAGMAGALVGFLRFNFPPARIYMGDGGAYFLGFLMGCQTIINSQKGTIFAALAAPLFVLALPIIDTTLAILRRGLRGLPLFRPDRKHLHHRLLASGYSRRKVVLGLYGFTAFFLLLGFLAFYWHGQNFALFLGIGTMAIILAAGRFNFSREWFSVGRVVGNSLEARADVQYAMTLSRCVAMSGSRALSAGEIAEDVVYIARKLDFYSVRIQLLDEEKSWKIDPSPAPNLETYRHVLNGHKHCFVELAVVTTELPDADPNALSDPRLNTCSILADLVAEGWNKAMKDWMHQHQLPARFDAKTAGPTVLKIAGKDKPDGSQSGVFPE